MNSNKDFVHLHLHSQYSLLDGAIQLKNLMEKLKSHNSNSVAVTDHGTMHGVIDFYKTALDNKIKPIIGCEVYVAPDDRRNRNYERGEDKNYHLILLAKNQKGLKNLQYLVSKAQLEGFYYKPRIDKQLLSEYSAGLIGLSACLAGEPPKHLMRGNFEKAVAAAKEYEDILKKGDYFLELQSNGIPEQDVINNQLLEISQKTGIPVVATNDCHYLNKGDHLSHQVLMCIQMQTTINNKDKLEFHSDQLYVKSPEEMWQAFSHIPEACTNTLRIAERCNVSFDFGKVHLPKYDVPEGYNLDTFFEHIAWEGLHKRLAHIQLSLHEEYTNRLKYEIEIIKMKGYAGYYLIVWDFIKYARNINVPVGPGRGSGAGSLVAYAMEITDIDPIKFNLLFERFLNPERESMPDFDIDFCKDKREKIISYVIDKYGIDKVGQIVTFGKLLARGVIRDVGRVLDIPLKIVDKAAKMIPEAPGMTLVKAIREDSSLEENIKEIEKGGELLDHAKKLEGLIRQTGMHAAGIVISDRPLIEYVPLCKGQNDEVLTQYEKDTLEKVGLVKFDFLGLKNLTVIDYAVNLIKEKGSPDFNINNIPLDDKDSYDLLSSGESTGVFQLESQGMRNLLKKLQPSVFEDIIALVALYRPGPMGSGMLDDFVKRKHGEQRITYPMKELEGVLKETYGILVYQEQVMQIAQIVAGYSLGSADLLRRAMGKKKPEEMQKHESIFLFGSQELKIEGAKNKGFDIENARDVFKLMEKFADYGFNKSHSAAYALIAYQTAYLKSHFPVEYMTALLSSELDKGEKVVSFIEECKRMEINVLPPDINLSSKDFVIDESSIRFGLGAIKNVGFGAIDEIIKSRNEKGNFLSIYDLATKLDLRQVNKKVIESLIKSGTFDSFGYSRRQLIDSVPSIIEHGQRKQKNRENGILTIEELLNEIDGNDISNPTDEYYPNVEEFPENELLKMEKEVLGFYLTKHPLSSYSALLDMFTTKTSDLVNVSEETDVIVGGIIKEVKSHLTKNGEKMAFISIEDIDGVLDAVAFPKVYRDSMRLIETDKIVMAMGRYSSNEEKSSLLINELYDVNEAIEKFTENIILKFNLIGFMDDRLDAVKDILSSHKGDIPLIFEFEMPTKFKALISLGDHYGISPKLSFFRQIDDLLGPNRYEITKIKKTFKNNTGDI